jgi:glucose-1-phosphate thymidylyltransferase
MVEIAGKPILTRCFEQLVDLGVNELIVVVGYRKQDIISHYGDEFRGVPITYMHQREQRGLAHALLTAENHVDDDFVLMLGDNVFEANLRNVIDRQAEDRADAAFLVEEVPWEMRHGTASVSPTTTARYSRWSRNPRAPVKPHHDRILHVHASYLPRV